MAGKFRVALSAAAGAALSGCALQAAMAARELAQYAPESKRTSNAHLKPAATEACSQRARQYGSVYILDAEQRRTDLIIVWGSVTDQQQRRRTFECHFTTSLKSFKLRDI